MRICKRKKNKLLTTSFLSFHSVEPSFTRVASTLSVFNLTLLPRLPLTPENTHTFNLWKHAQITKQRTHKHFFRIQQHLVLPELEHTVEEEVETKVRTLSQQENKKDSLYLHIEALLLTGWRFGLFPRKCILNYSRSVFPAPKNWMR